jgi:hypothetical protein
LAFGSPHEIQSTIAEHWYTVPSIEIRKVEYLEGLEFFGDLRFEEWKTTGYVPPDISFLSL